MTTKRAAVGGSLAAIILSISLGNRRKKCYNGFMELPAENMLRKEVSHV